MRQVPRHRVERPSDPRIGTRAPLGRVVRPPGESTGRRLRDEASAVGFRIEMLRRELQRRGELDPEDVDDVSAAVARLQRHVEVAAVEARRGPAQDDLLAVRDAVVAAASVAADLLALATEHT